jgi:hypothetical protein
MLFIKLTPRLLRKPRTDWQTSLEAPQREHSNAQQCQERCHRAQQHYYLERRTLM